MEKQRHPTILLVGEEFFVLRCEHFLTDTPLEVFHAPDGKTALARLDQASPDIVLLDLDLPDMNGLKVLQYAVEHHSNTAVIVLTSESSVSVISEILSCGAVDFVEKPFNKSRICLTIRNVLKYKHLSAFVEQYKTSFESGEYYGFIGNSQAMQTIYRIIDNVATSKASVFITGESGTGKDLCAEAIHKRSKRKDGPFVALNCAAIPRDLAESQIFGHVKGAFSGAVSDHLGAAQQAHLGTFFLDEIGDMDINLQSKLLRFIQTGSFQKVGGNKLEQVDVRFICATNRNPLAEVQAGRFREDLYYRLSVISIGLPALRKREEDVLLIAKAFLKKYALEENKSFLGFAEETEKIFSHYHWPGNVRQLQNVVHNVVVMHEGGIVTPSMLPPPLDNLTVSSVTQPSATSSFHTPSTVSPIKKSGAEQVIRPLREAEKELIEQAIVSCEGDVPKAALLLGVSASTIYRKLRSWNS